MVQCLCAALSDTIDKVSKDRLCLTHTKLGVQRMLPNGNPWFIRPKCS